MTTDEEIATAGAAACNRVAQLVKGDVFEHRDDGPCSLLCSEARGVDWVVAANTICPMRIANATAQSVSDSVQSIALQPRRAHKCSQN